MQFVRPLVCLCLLISTAFAQTVRWENAGTGDPADLQLVFEDCKPDGDPVIPAPSGAALSFRGTSEQTSIINFSVTRTLILSFRLQIKKGNTVEIPAFKIKTNKGEVNVAAYSTGTVRPGPEADVHATLVPARKTLWAGEVFPLTYSLDAARRTFNNFGGGIEWDPSPLLTEDWGKPEVNEATRGGESRIFLTFRTRAYAKTAGNYRLKPLSQLINLALGSASFRLFQQQRIEQVTVNTDEPEIRVRPLPHPAPTSFTGAVGDYKLISKVVPTSAAVGEPITWTLELSGTGNWPDIAGLPSREVSTDFQVIQPQAKQTPEEGKLFDATLAEDVVLVPTKPGTYSLGSIEFTFFDPKSGTYQTARTPATTVTVKAAAAPRFNVLPPTTESTQPPTGAEKIPPPAAATNPEGIPRDPLAGSAITGQPFASSAALLRAVLWPLGGLLLIWLGLAARRTRQTDALNPRRFARQRLRVTLSRLATASVAERPALLIAWQHDAARLWSINQAAPAAHALRDAEWSTLWTEAEHALYSTKNELPSDWLARADAALVAAKVPGIAWWRLVTPRNLLPFLAVALMLTILPPLHAADPAEAYGHGEFTVAEQGWRAAVEAAPTDWVARHNLSLALAQQERWAEAAAHATAAFVQNPRVDASRWNLALAYTKAGYTPTALAPLLVSGPRSDLARLASPSGWETRLVISSVVVAVALLVWLLIGYGLAPRWARWPALSVALLAIFVGVGSLAGRASYGLAADPQAALVWRAGKLYSIPTEADVAQQTTTLAAGAMGTMDKTFLGWTRLSFPNGQTGWVRQSELVTLWR